LYFIVYLDNLHVEHINSYILYKIVVYMLCVHTSYIGKQVWTLTLFSHCFITFHISFTGTDVLHKKRDFTVSLILPFISVNLLCWTLGRSHKCEVKKHNYALWWGRIDYHIYCLVNKIPKLLFLAVARVICIFVNNPSDDLLPSDKTHQKCMLNMWNCQTNIWFSYFKHLFADK